MRLWPVLAVALLLAGCGGGMPTAALTPTATFARFTNADVVATFRKFGMYASDVHPVTGTRDLLSIYYPDTPSMPNNTGVFVEGSTQGAGYLLAFSRSADMETVWSRLNTRPLSFLGSADSEAYRNGNVIMIFCWANTKPFNFDPYIAAFIGMR